MKIARKIGLPVLLATLAALTLLSPACAKKPSAAGSASRSLPADFPSGKPYFVRVPPPADWSRLSKPLRSFDKARKWGPLYDLRHADLSRLDLTNRASDLLNSFFDTETKWPAALPPGFEPAKILDSSRNPGLGLRALHARGITGKGVAAAVIDTPILLDHDEYVDRLRFYDEVNAWGEANFHGTLVTSILAGHTCGVAPEAEIYYVGSHPYDISPADNSMAPNSTHFARAIDMFLEINVRLPREKRIRVISISGGWGRTDPGFRAMNKAVRKAAEAGVFVVSGNLFDASEPGFWFWGLDRASTDSPDDPAAYRVISWKDWISQVGVEEFPKFYEKRLQRSKSQEFLLVPVGSKTVAHPHGRSQYGFYRMGGWSSLCPYIAGLYALACQVKPDITPEIFWKAALATGDPMPIKKGEKTYAGKRVNPVRLIESLK
ncbi:MAG: S8 family serine peptidase [Acidobacteria bacterium]|nr:S8 family serine peptidase [Acidobacteriota bacterium]